jgi:hypothetical protein
MTEVAPADSTRPRATLTRGLTPRGCLLIVLAAWAVWVLVDLWRLDVFDGSRALGDAVFDMPSIGLLILVAIGVTALVVRVRNQDRRKREFPGQPWMWEKRWNRNGARPIAAEKLTGPMVFAVSATFACGIVAGLSLAILDDPLLRIAVTPFYVVGLGAWLYAGNRAARVVKFRHTWFEYDSFPFFVGRKLSGALVGIEPATGADTITATLRLVQEHWSSGSRSGRSRVRSVVREEARQYRREDIVDRAVLWGAGPRKPSYGLRPALAVAFDLPADARQTALLSEPAFLWELQVTATRPGLDVDVTFLLPVYTPPQAALATPRATAQGEVSSTAP